jgi:heme oxygenase
VDASTGHLDLTSRDDYRQFLEASAAALLPLEAALTAAGVDRHFPDWDQRSRRTAILDDLAKLRGDIRLLATPGPLDLGEMLGVMYVLEGSRLGARMLSQTVVASTDPVVASATAYLRHGEGRPLWPTFIARLNNQPTAGINSRAVGGARMAFAMFLAAFTGGDRIVTRGLARA